MKKAAVEKLVIVRWYTPEERLPEDDLFVPVTVSGKIGNIRYEHALMIGSFFRGEGWYFEGLDTEAEMDQLTVHAWCDLDPYGGGA